MEPHQPIAQRAHSHVIIHHIAPPKTPCSSRCHLHLLPSALPSTLHHNSHSHSRSHSHSHTRFHSLISSPLSPSHPTHSTSPPSLLQSPMANVVGHFPVCLLPLSHASNYLLRNHMNYHGCRARLNRRLQPLLPNIGSTQDPITIFNVIQSNHVETFAVLSEPMLIDRLSGRRHYSIHRLFSAIPFRTLIIHQSIFNSPRSLLKCSVRCEWTPARHSLPLSHIIP